MCHRLLAALQPVFPAVHDIHNMPSLTMSLAVLSACCVQPSYGTSTVSLRLMNRSMLAFAMHTTMTASALALSSSIS